MPIQEHSQLAGHQTTQDNFSIIDREGQDFLRLIKESIFIRINNATLNRNTGKFQLSHIWDSILFSTSGIMVAIPQGNVQHSPLLLYKSQHLWLQLDLMKTIAMVESLSMQIQCSVQRILQSSCLHQWNDYTNADNNDDDTAQLN